MNITKKIKEQGNQAGALLAEAIDNTVELDLSQYSIEGTHIVVLSAPDDSYPGAIIDENIAKKALSWKVDPSKTYLSVKVGANDNLLNFIFDRRNYFGQSVDIDLDGDKVEELYASAVFVPSEDSLVVTTCIPQVDTFGPGGNTIRLEISIAQYLISATQG